jgi:uncharacterized RDD family membrane protein YckC
MRPGTHVSATYFPFESEPKTAWPCSQLLGRRKGGIKRNTLSQSQSLPAWKEEINAKLHAHRSRRGSTPEPEGTLEPEGETGSRLTSRVAARVAERYAKAPSYREVLAEEAAKAARAAEAAAKAAHEAHAAAQAMLQELTNSRAETGPRGLRGDEARLRNDTAAGIPHGEERREAAEPQSRWEEMRAPAPEASVPDPRPDPNRDSAPDLKASDLKPQDLKLSDLTQALRPAPLPEPLQYRVSEASLPPTLRRPVAAAVPEAVAPAEPASAATLFEDPIEEATVEPAQPLPARVIEFPRQLVASRKVRPRLEEGPLREEAEAAQLRIFEVEPASVSHEPVVEAVLPEWHSIHLDAAPKQEPAAGVLSAELMDERPNPLLESPIMSASLEDRLMAGIVDLSLVLAGFLLFVATFVACTTHPPKGKPAVMGAAIALVALFAVYQWLFFYFADGTPGMRYAKIALCTFDDENPTRGAMRRRIGASLLAALPLGLGFLWALFDEDHLGWHDRMTQTYQRSYKD